MQWENADITVQYVLTGSQTLDAVALGFVTLPSGAAVTIEGSNDGGSTWVVFSEALTVQDVVMTHIFTSSQTVDALRIIITGATGGELGWFWAGDSFTTGVAAQINLRRQVQMSSPVVGAISRRFSSRALGGNIVYDNFLNNASKGTEDDAVEFETMFDYSKSNGNWPLIFVANIALSNRVILGAFTQDELLLDDLFWFQPGTEAEQAISLTFDFEGISA